MAESSNRLRVKPRPHTRWWTVVLGVFTVVTVAWRVFEAWSTVEFVHQKSGTLWTILRFLVFSPTGANLLVVVFAALFVASLLFQIERNAHSEIGESPAPPEITTPTSRLLTAADDLTVSVDDEPPANLICMRTGVTQGHESDGYLRSDNLTDRNWPKNAVIAVIDICNEFSPERRTGNLEDVSAEIDYTGRDGRVFKVKRGSWLSETAYKVPFNVNDRHELIIAAYFWTTDEPNPFLLTQEMSSWRESVSARSLPLQQDSYQVKVRLISESKGMVYTSFDFVLKLKREPEFSFDLTPIGTAPPAQIPSLLEVFLVQGKGLLRQCEQSQLTEDVIVDWETNVSDFLMDHTPASYKIRFLSNAQVVRHQIAAATTSHRRLLDWLSTRIARLEEIIIELEDKSRESH